MSHDDILSEFLLRYPGLIHESGATPDFVFRGTVKVESTWHRVHLRCPQFPKITKFELKIQKFHRIQTIDSQFDGIDSKWTAYDLIDNLNKLLPNKCADIVSASQPLKIQEQNIYAEVAALYAPEDYKLHVNHDCTHIRFTHFANYEQHYLELKMPELQIVQHSLPDCMPWLELFAQKCHTLTKLVRQFQQYLEDLQPFYDNFVDIDELCHVVQPAKPTTKHNWRLFVLRDRVFLKLTIIDPFSPIASMTVHIIGPTYELEKLRHVYSEGMRDWDADLDIHKNLLRIFDLCFFPMPSNNVNVEENEVFCNICYCYQQVNGDIPVVSCDNMQCNLIYHATCLQEWFNTLSDGKVFLDVSLGTCPFCKAKLSASFAELMVD